MTVVDRIRELCRENNMSITTLEQELCFSNGSITKPKVIPSDRLFKIAQYFNVPMEYLLGATRPSCDYLSIDEKILIECYRDSDVATRDLLKRIVEYANKMNGMKKDE